MTVSSALDKRTESLLREWLRLVLVDVCIGFAELKLDAELTEHREVLSHIVQDFSGVYS